MLDLILGSSPDAFSCGELWAAYRPSQRHHLHPTCGCGQHPCPVWRHLLPTPPSTIHSKIASQLGVRYVVDSSKDLRWFVDIANWNGRHPIRIIPVVIWKDLKALAFSLWRRSSPELQRWPHYFYSYYHRFLQLRVPFVSIAHQDLTKTPVDTLQQLCRVIGMPYIPALHQFWEATHHPLFGSAGTRSQLGDTNSHLVISPDYPDEFEEYYQKHLSPLNEHPLVSSALASLRSHDTSRLAAHGTHPVVSPPVRRPLWYYMFLTRDVLLRVRLRLHSSTGCRPPSSPDTPTQRFR